jgi:hypothetical protein
VTTNPDAACNDNFAILVPHLYVSYMPETPSPPVHRPRAPHAVHVRIGGWFEASASGWGVVVVPLLLLAMLAAALAPQNLTTWPD